MLDEQYHFRKTEELVELEFNSLNERSLSHHTNWDNHVLTLSTGSIGFIVSFLFKDKYTLKCLVITSLVMFVFSILAAMICYMVSDHAMRVQEKGNSERRKVLFKLKELELEHQKEARLLDKDDVDKFIELTESYRDKMLEVTRKNEERGESSQIETINNWITGLNYAKTILFVLGVMFTTIYAGVNLS